MAIPRGALAGVRAVFSDLDGTITSGGRVTPKTYAAIGALADAGVPFVVVTGRPSGWGETLARLWPVTAVIAENGGVIIARDARGRLRRRFALPPAELARVRKRMRRAVAHAAREVPGARLSSDSTFTEVNLAVDWNEDVKLPERAARRLETILRARGFAAVRSSVHVNFWPRGFDKLTACKKVVREVLGGDPAKLAPYIYVGDALNDEPMFAGFPRSIGVANVKDVWADLAQKPAFVTRAAEGAGFEEVVRAVLRAR